MQLLKAVVIILGMLIVAGVAVIATTIYMRSQELSAGRNGTPSTQTPPRQPLQGAFGARRVAVPDGSIVRQVTAAGERLVVWLGGEAGQARLVVLDLATGAELGTFVFEPAP